MQIFTMLVLFFSVPLYVYYFVAEPNPSCCCCCCVLCSIVRAAIAASECVNSYETAQINCNLPMLASSSSIVRSATICKRIWKCFRYNSFDAVFIYLVHSKAKITIIISTMVNSKQNERGTTTKARLYAVFLLCH